MIVYLHLYIKNNVDQGLISNYSVSRTTDLDANLDVLCVCRLQFLSEVRVSLQNLDHLSEVAVVVQARVLQTCVIQLRLQQGDSQLISYQSNNSQTHHVLLLRFLLLLLVPYITIDGHRPHRGRDEQEQQPNQCQGHCPVR